MINFGIKGEYIININIPTMFGCYKMQVKGHNKVVNQGMEFFLKKAMMSQDNETSDYHSSVGVIGYITVGDGEGATEDTTTSLVNPTKNFKWSPTNVKVDVNTLTIREEAKGSDLDGTTEIGVCTSRGLLISRDTHYAYSIPHTAIIEIYYTFTITNIEADDEDEEEE